MAFLGVYTRPYLETRLGDRYVWIPKCGNRTRQLPPTLVDEGYCLKRIRDLMSHGRGRVVLLCAERDEARCHRRYIKDKIGDVAAK